MSGYLQRGKQVGSRKEQLFASPSGGYNVVDAQVKFTEELQPGAALREISDGVTNARTC